MDIESPASPQAHARPVGLIPQGLELSAVASRHMMLIDQLIAWQISNPGKPMTHAAQAFGVSTLFLRMLASTDAYKARYQDVSDKLIESVGIMGLKEKIKAAAEMAVERLAEKIPTMESAQDLRDVTEMLLDQTYKNDPAQVPQHITVNQNLILEARAQIVQGSPTPSKEGA